MSFDTEPDKIIPKVKYENNGWMQKHLKKGGHNKTSKPEKLHKLAK